MQVKQHNYTTMASTTKLPSIHPQAERMDKSSVSKENPKLLNGYPSPESTKATKVQDSTSESPDLPPLHLHQDGYDVGSTISSDWPLSDPRGMNPRKGSLPLLDIGVMGVNPGLGLFPGAYQSYSMYEMVSMFLLLVLRVITGLFLNGCHENFILVIHFQ